MLRGTIAGLLAFFVAGYMVGRLAAAAMPDEWSVAAGSAVGLAAVALAAAVAGAVGAWQAGRLAGAVPGPLLGALLLVAADPDTSLATALALVVVTAAGAGGGVLSQGPISVLRDSTTLRTGSPPNHT
jgi:hypothetical protein